ncbi:TetR family transcriptional regulator [Caballeronia udeis]|uniref:TetR family transcriptional regulator n=1 Tax=Caballeronia udeis TaxID=1232866 RepID=A0A158FGM7_9BURK|nr:TetR/AcrR family transcriptional regulator [Caballeronia udeis]SAL19032.1 TetR family transcriptional regulator [Caballeronia udeis]
MAAREGLRPGGRSARVQESVHHAVRTLLDEMPREELTVPQVAARAGVTPSTIYRRWGDLPTLLADVALQRFHPDNGPADTGTLRSDLETWAQGYQEEMSSAPGRAMTRDVLASNDPRSPACQCAAITRSQIQMILDRAAERGETPPDVHAVMDQVVAPLIYRLLFDDLPIDPAFARTRMAVLLDRTRQGS